MFLITCFCMFFVMLSMAEVRNEQSHPFANGYTLIEPQSDGLDCPYFRRPVPLGQRVLAEAIPEAVLLHPT